MPLARELSPKVQKSLIESGVYNSLFPEVARAGWEEEELLALAAWCRADNPKKPGGLFMIRLRGGLNPPESYFHPPCPVCGMVGVHNGECSRRYVSGPFADYILH